MKQLDIDHVVKAVVQRCHTEEEVCELLSGLASVNWVEAIAKKRYEDSLRPCQMCNEWKVVYTFSYVLDRNAAGFVFHHTCPECIEEIKNTWSCSYCDKIYPSLLMQDRDYVCSKCRHISELVKIQNMRAKKLDLPATLTVWQWREAIRYFNGKCAYGDHAYEVLEHYLPVTKGGGTIVGNCVPACNACNLKKGNRHPDQLHKFFPSDNLARIREYLTGVAMKQSA